MFSVSVIKGATSLTNVEIRAVFTGKFVDQKPIVANKFRGEVGTNVTIFVFGLAFTFIQNLFKATGRFAN